MNIFVDFVLLFTVVQSDASMVRTLGQKLQQNTQCLNPEYLVFSPKGSSNTKTPLLIYLHGAGGVGV